MREKSASLAAGLSLVMPMRQQRPWEEIGLPPEQTDIIGPLLAYHTGTGFHVAPVVAALRPPPAWRPDPLEVAAVFEVPLDWILGDGALRLVTRRVRDRQRQFYSAMWQGYEIWGATAGILMSLKAALEQPPGDRPESPSAGWSAKQRDVPA